MKKSSGFLIYKKEKGKLKVFLVHPGGPYWKNKDEGAWSIPKGKQKKDESILEAAVREVEEELGSKPKGKITFVLGKVKQNKNKTVYCWAFKGDVKLPISSNTTELEYPHKSGKYIEIPEVDDGKWFSIKKARKKINPKQEIFIDRLLRKLND